MGHAYDLEAELSKARRRYLATISKRELVFEGFSDEVDFMEDRELQ